MSKISTNDKKNTSLKKDNITLRTQTPFKHDKTVLKNEKPKIEKIRSDVPRKDLIKKSRINLAEALVKKPEYKIGKYIQEKLNAQDLMFLAKHFPGQFQSSYVLGGDISTLATSVVKSQFSATTALIDHSPWGQQNFGKCTFTVFMYCPQLGLYHNATGPSPYKVGGLSVYQTDSTNSPQPIISNLLGFVPGSSYSMADIYGSEGAGISNNLFPWSSEITGHCQAPAGAVSGTAHYVKAPISSFFDSDGNQIGVTINGWKKSVFKSVPLEETNGRFILSNAIVDNDAGARTGIQNVTATDFQKVCNQMGMEQIVAVIIEQPYVSLVTGTLMEFPIDFHVQSNVAFSPKIQDSMARSVQKQQPPVVVQARPNQILPNYEPYSVPIEGLNLKTIGGNFMNGAMDFLTKVAFESMRPGLNNGIMKNLSNSLPGGGFQGLGPFKNFTEDKGELNVNCASQVCKLNMVLQAGNGLQCVDYQLLQEMITYYQDGSREKPAYKPDDSVEYVTHNRVGIKGVNNRV